MYNAADDSLLNPVSPCKISSSLPRLVSHLLLLLGVLEDTLNFQAPPGLLKSPSLNAARNVSNLARNRDSVPLAQKTYLVSGLNQYPTMPNAIEPKKP